MWIALSLIYALTNAFYTGYNDTKHYNGYMLGIWRGFGVSLCTAPMLLTISINITVSYLMILIIQGLLIGLYDSHIFFASSFYSSRQTAGFMTTTVLITVFLWWGLEINDLKTLLQNPPYFITLMLILIGYTISYWQTMRVHINYKAEQYLYPAVFALSLMSIATRFIAIHGGSMRAGIIYYLTFSCFTSGIYNWIMYIKTKKALPISPPISYKDGTWLIFLSIILISAKTAALRLCTNPGYVVALLMLSPLFTEILKTHQINITQWRFINCCFLIALLCLVD